MRYIKLGTTGLDVSPVAIGAMTYGDPTLSGRWDEQTSPTPHQARHRGAGLTSSTPPTCTLYGSSEEILGRALKGLGDPRRRRDCH